MDRLSDDNLTLADQLLAELTPGDYDLGRSGTATHEEAIAWFTRCLVASENTDLFGVFSDTADAPDSRLIALTGNGPNSERNARAICNLLRMFPYLLAEVRSLRGTSNDAPCPRCGELLFCPHCGLGQGT